MTSHDFHTAHRIAAFGWKIVCRSGVISFGCNADFLLTLVIAKQQKARWTACLPYSTFRVHLLYPNGQRVSKHDIKAALAALADQRIGDAVATRLVAHADVPPAAQARTERTADATGDFCVASQLVFCQAGVVAPPDSPDLGNQVEVDSVAVGV
jgi:hypothetical protein